MKIPPASAVPSSTSRRGEIRRLPRALATSIAALLAGAALCQPTSASAANITWTPAANISGDTNVSTAGTLINAFAMGSLSSSGATVNGVTFAQWRLSVQGTTNGNYALSGAGTYASFGTSSTSAPFSTLSANYQTLLSSDLGTTDSPGSFTMTISGLTAGQTYQFEFWNDTSTAGGTFPLKATAGNSLTLSSNTSPGPLGGTEGGLGQFGIGYFTASGTTQQIVFSGFNEPATNAFELRSVAAASYWLGETSGSWAGNNWASDSTGTTTAAIPTDASDITFSATGAQRQNSTTLDQNFTIHSLTISDSNPVTISSGASTHTLTISGNAGTGITVNSGAGLFTLNANLTLAGSSDTITVSNAAGAVINGTIGGSNGLIKAGTGTLTLGAANNYTGATTVSDGTLKLGINNALPTGTTVTINQANGHGNALLDLNGHSQTIAGLTIIAPDNLPPLGGSTVDLNGGVLTLAGNVSVVNNTTVAGNGDPSTIQDTAGGGALDLGGATRTFTIAGQDNNTGDLRINAVIQGTGGVVINALPSTFDSTEGGVVFGAANTYTGSTTVAQGRLTTTAANALPSTTDLVLGTANSALTGDVNLNGNNQTVNSLSLAGGNTGGTGNFITGAATLTVSSTTTNSTFGGLLTGSLSLVKDGTGTTLTLTTANNYTGSTTISAGTIADGIANALPTGTALTDNATLDLAGFNQQVASVTGSGTVTDSGAAATFTVNNASADSFGGTITGTNLSLTAAGTVTLTLTSANSYGGVTTINSGATIADGITNALPTGTALTANGTLDLAGFNQQVASLTGTGTVTDSGGVATLTVANSSADTFGGAITGTNLSLTAAGTAALTLSHANTYGGSTTINSGATIADGIANALPTGTALSATGTLDLAGFNQQVASVTGSGTVTDSGAAATFTVNNGSADTFAGTITGANLSLTKSGVATLTLSNANTYGGTTTVNQGTLNITGTSTGGGAFAINGSGSILTISSSGTVAASGVTFAGTGSETLNLNGGTFLVGAGGISTPAVPSGGLVFNGGTLKSSAAFTISSDLPIAILSNSTIDTSGGNISSHSGFGNSASPGNLTIQGGNTLTGAFDSTMTGEIFVTGNTTLAMASASTATGILSIASGSKLDLNNSSASFGGLTGAGSVVNSTGSGVSTFTLTGPGGNNFSGVISAANPADTAVAINLTSGIQTFSGANTYGGGTTINGGTLLANNTTGSATGTGTVTINTGGTLGGSGTISGPITLNGTIAPGAGSPGVAGTTLHAASLAWNGGGTLTLQLGATGDQLALSGAVTKLTTTVGPYTINILNAGITQNAYTLATFGSTTFAAGDFTLVLPAGFSAVLLETTTSLSLGLAFSGTGPLIQNAAPTGTPPIADFTVTGPVSTGGPLANNTINSLIFTPGGTLTIFNTLTLTSGNVTTTGGTNSIMGGTLFGPNGLHFDVNGNLFIGSTLVGNAVKTGTGSLFLDGALFGNLQVLEGLLGGNGSIFGNLFNAGIVSPGHSPGRIGMSGNFTQAPSGLLRIEIGGTDLAQHDLLSVGGKAYLDGTLQLVQLNGFTLKRNQSVTFLTAAAGVNGKFATVENGLVTDTILQPTVVYGDTSVAVEALQGSFAALPGLTPNQQSVGRALDSAANDRRANSLFDYLDYRTLDKLPGDLDKISPEELTSVYTLGVSLATVQSLNVQRRTDDIRSGSSGFNAANLALNGDNPSFSGGFGIGTGVAGPNGSAVPQGDDGKEVKETKSVVPAENRWGVFLSGTGEWVSVGNTDNARGYDLESGGFTLGVDYKVTPNLAIGLAAGYTGTTADLTNNGRIWVNGGQIGLYGTFFQNEQAAPAPTMSKDASKEAPAPAPSVAKGLYADVAVFGGYNSYDTRRSALQGEARGSTDGGELNVLFGTGYDFKSGGLTFGPTATFNYTYIGTSDFTEHGSLAPLDVHGGKGESLRSAFGFKASYDWKVGGIVIKPELRAAWQHEYGDAAYAMDSSFASGAGNSFLVNGPKLGRDSALLGAGFAIQLNERLSTYFYYDGELGRTNYQSTSVTGGVRFAF